MKQTKPNLWSCAVTSFAMAIGIPVQQLIEEIGHDGSEKIFTHLPEPMCRRGFHSQELIRAAWNHGFACTPLELFPALKPTDGQGAYVLMNELDSWARFKKFILTTRGVLEGASVRCHHAVYYRYGQIFDPDGWGYSYSREACEAHGFHGKRLWIFTQL